MLGETKTKRKKQPNAEGPSDLTKIIKLVMDRNFDPVIVFSFAKRECETYAMLMSKQVYPTGLLTLLCKFFVMFNSAIMCEKRANNNCFLVLKTFFFLFPSTIGFQQ